MDRVNGHLEGPAQCTKVDYLNLERGEIDLHSRSKDLGSGIAMGGES